jgi:hypothetical protein
LNQAKTFFIFIPHKSHKTIVVRGIFATIFITLLEIFYLGLMNSLAIFGNNFSVKNIVGYSFVITVRTFFSAQFVFACFIIQKRFEAMNVHLMNSIALKKFNFYAHKSFLTSKYATLYHKLCNGIDVINSTFTFQLIFVLQ